jgi:hypothetical protein
MADKTDDIRQEIKKGRQEIADTRAAITEKLTILEDRVQETVDGVKHSFDLHYQVKQRPWLLFGGSLLLGYLLGPRGGSSSATDDRRESFARAQAHPGMVADVRNQFKSEITTIKEAVFGAVISTLWAMAKQVLLPPAQHLESVNLKSNAQRSEV